MSEPEKESAPPPATLDEWREYALDLEKLVRAYQHDVRKLESIAREHGVACEHSHDSFERPGFGPLVDALAEKLADRYNTSVRAKIFLEAIR